jgi:hypothetical protein
MVTLDGSDTTHPLGDGIAIRAPGTMGTIVLDPAVETTAGAASSTVLTGDAEVDDVLGQLFSDRARLDAAITATSKVTITVEPPAGGTAVLVVADPRPDGMITFHSPDVPPVAEAHDARHDPDAAHLHDPCLAARGARGTRRHRGLGDPEAGGEDFRDPEARP